MSGVTAVRERSKRCFTRDYATVFNKRHPRVDISSLSRKATFFPLLVAIPPAATGLELPRCFIYEAVEKSDRRRGVGGGDGGGDGGDEMDGETSTLPWIQTGRRGA